MRYITGEIQVLVRVWVGLMGHKRSEKSETDEHEGAMSARAFRAWRKRLDLKQKDAADLLGLKKRMIQYYETGSRNGQSVSIPKPVRLACYALEHGILDYDGETPATRSGKVNGGFEHGTGARSS